MPNFVPDEQLAPNFVTEQLAYVAAMRAGKTEALTAAARASDKSCHAELNKLRAKPCNAECFDCSARRPGWAVLPWGTFVCIDCAQVHHNPLSI